MTPASKRLLLRPLAALLALLLASTGPAAAQALTPTFTYQGELRLASGPANGSFDMQFRLYDAQAGGAQIGATLTTTNLLVAGGLFAAPLDFGPAQFAGDRQWLEIAIRPAGTGSYETLSPRTEVTAAPYAWSAAVALANSVTTTSIVDGTIGSADINVAQIQRRVTGTCPAGQYVRVVAQDGSVSCGSDADSGGTVTSIATGAGLTGGPITGSGTIAVAAGGIGSGQINAAQVQRRVSGSCPGGQYVRVVNQDGSVECGTDVGGTPGWGLSGNAGTNPAVNFLGTSDSQPLELRTANARSLRIEPSSITFGSPALPITSNTIGGSHANAVTAGARGATIGGGGVPVGDSDPDFSLEAPNRVTDHYGTVGGGYANLAGDDADTPGSAAYATVAGGRNNAAGGFTSTIGGGQGHVASGGWSTIGGGVFNTGSGVVSTIGGGELNIANGNDSTIGGGRSNTASGLRSSVGGGDSHVASGDWSSIGGGFNSSASARFSVVGGGSSNLASGEQSTVGGGLFNVASGPRSTVGGGSSNAASGITSTVSGGFLNCAGGFSSWAGGNRAKARPGTDAGTEGGACAEVASSGDVDGDEGTFIWSDRQNQDFVSSGPNQFLVRAAGGAVITGSSVTNDPMGSRLRVDGTLRIDALGAGGATSLCRNAGNQVASCSSSERYKRDIGDLELGLEAALRLRAVDYCWKDTGAADIGFVAEEIAAIDERLVTRSAQGQIEGVRYDRMTALLANALQALAARASLVDEALADLQIENAALRADLDRRDAERRTDQQHLAAELAKLRSLLRASPEQR